MKRVAISTLVALAVLAVYVGFVLFILWGDSPGTWEQGNRFIAGLFGIAFPVTAYRVAYKAMARTAESRHG